MKVLTHLKRLALPAAIAATLVTGASAHAGSTGHHNNYRSDTAGYTIDSARVTQVDPMYETVRIETPRRECRTEVVERRDDRHDYRRSNAHGRSFTPQLIGAVIGAGIGRKFGDGRGKDLGTVAGAVLGASVGRDVNRHHRRHRNHHNHRDSNASRTYVEHAQVCEDVANYHEEQRIVGYRVQYRYNGRHYWTQTDQNPGDRIEVRVSVSPASS